MNFKRFMQFADDYAGRSKAVIEKEGIIPSGSFVNLLIPCYDKICADGNGRMFTGAEKLL